MSLKYAPEHLACYNYEKNQFSSLENIFLYKGEAVTKNITETVIIFVLEGSCSISHARKLDEHISAGNMILLPPGTGVRLRANERVTAVICRVKGVTRLCECMSFEKLFAETREYDKSHSTLPVNEYISDFLRGFRTHVGNGLKCIYFFDLKVKELFFLLRAYYLKEDLAGFFAPLLSNDSRFTFFVYNNFKKVKNVQELVTLSVYSESNFKKKFLKTFGIPPSEWLREQKSVEIFHDLNCTSLSIKEISDKYDFASVSSLSIFCKKNLGEPPGQIRKRGM